MTGRPKGYPKSGGRQPGTPNKRLTYSVERRLQELGVDLISEIIEDLKELDPHSRVKAKLELLEYCDAKRKAVEVSGDHKITAENAQATIVRLPDDITTKLLDESPDVA